MLDASQVNAILPNWEQLDWYYSVELSPGVYTKGKEFNNIALTKRMLDNIDLGKASVLDVGAMEGAMSVIMAKRGANVLAADGIDLTDRVTLVQRAHGVQFSYFPHMPLHRFAERIFEIQASRTVWLAPEIGPSEKTNFGFDVVLSSGVLYHVLNPVEHLITYRKLCKLGGLVVLETAAAISDDVSFIHAMRPDGTLYNGFSSWFVTTASVDLLLRSCYLEPLAFCYVSRQDIHGTDTARICVVARAVGKKAFDPVRYKRYEEVSTSEMFYNIDFAGLQPAALLTGVASKKMTLKMDGLHSAAGGLMTSAFNENEPLHYDPQDLRLSL